MIRFRIVLMCALVYTCGVLNAEIPLPEPPVQKRPAWLRENGIVMAGAWEALSYRLRAGGSQTYEQKMESWRAEHSEEIARRLKDLGFNFVMIPLYKGFGIENERSAMEDAKAFTEICHRLGLRVGCYTFSGTIGWEAMLADDPGVREWMVMDHEGKYLYYDVKYYRRWVNRGHPAVREHIKKAIRYAIEEAKVDLIHMDNYHIGPGYEPFSVRAFREYLKKKYTPEMRIRRFGFTAMDFMEAPPPPPQPDRYNVEPLYRDFVDYRSETLAESYRELTEYARSLNPEIVMELNCHGYYGNIGAHASPIGTVDHTQLLPWGSAFWDEGYPSRLEGDLLISRFRSHKLGRQFGNSVFQYTSDPVAMAESLANNLQSLGCPVWFAGGKIVPFVSNKGSKELEPFVTAAIRFFRERQEYFRDTEEIADVGVLNTYGNSAYGPQVTRDRRAAFEQALYQGKVPFTLVPGRYPGKLSRFRVLVLADVALISDKLVEAIRDYVREGGGLVMTGQAATFDENHIAREAAGLSGLFPRPLGDSVQRAHPGKGRAIYIPKIEIPAEFKMGMLPENRAELLDAVRWAAGGPFEVEVKAPETVTMSYYRQPGGRRLLHLVNYNEGKRVPNIKVTLQAPNAKQVPSVKWVTPQGDGPRTLAAQQKDGTLRFTVPELEIYGLAVIE